MRARRLDTAPRALAAIVLAALLLPSGGLAAGAATARAPPAGDAWEVVVTDPTMDATHPMPGAPAATDPRVDLVEVAIAEDERALWVRLRTREASPAPGLTVPTAPGEAQGPVTTEVELQVRSGRGDGSLTVRLVAENRTLTVHRQDTPVQTVPLAAEDAPWRYAVALARAGLGAGGPLTTGDRIESVVARTSRPGAFGAATDEAWSGGPGSAYVVRRAVESPVGSAPLPAWRESTFVHLAAGPSVAVARDGTLHLAYLVYGDDRGVARGLHHAVVPADGAGAFDASAARAERVADARMPTELHEATRTQTALALDDTDRPHIVFHPRPGGEDAGMVRFASKDAAWVEEDPSSLADGRRLEVDDSHGGVPAVVVGRGGRVVVAFQSGADVAIVERAAPGRWTLLERLEDARFPRLAVDGTGRVHVAWLGGTTFEREVGKGTLRYANEAGGFAPADVATGIMDYSRFWETSETDGSFAFALDRNGVPHFVWESDSDETPLFGSWRQGRLQAEAAPLTPSHGNPQVRMRMGFDGAGNAHVVSGYGGLDTYAVRHANGVWQREERPRGDIFSLAIAPDGRAVLAYTQPHGGTTLAVSSQAHPVGASPSTAVGALVGQRGGAISSPLATWVLLGAALGAFAGWALWASIWSTVAAAFASRAWRSLALVGGFTRIAAPRLAEHRTRADVLRAVEASPGIDTATLRRQLGVPRTTLLYHLRRLERERLVVVRARGASLLVAPPGVALQSEQALPMAARELLAAIRAAPGGTADDYAARLAAPRRTVAHRLGALERDGHVARASEGRPARWRAR